MPPRILIVDDEPLIANLASAILSSAGFEVRTATSAEEAVAICTAQSFSLVISDVRMPGMNGHELARWIAVNHPSTKTMLMSGFDLACENCAYSPRCDLLPKPFRSGQLISVVKSMLPDCAG